MLAACVIMGALVADGARMVKDGLLTRNVTFASWLALEFGRRVDVRSKYINVHPSGEKHTFAADATFVQ